MYGFNPLDTMNAAFAGWRMAAEAQSVIVYRMMGMAGLWAVAPSENSRMISEKGPTLMAAQNAAMRKAISGGSAEEIYSAWLKPIGQKTRANQKRLAKRGFTHGCML
ncbi:hypothetical protein LX81_02140 [Palleronia aestuarii]|uniref:Antifreeze protein n=1 Tax=Palleronia aestuarii TaxID=568105 RepID=A0A2W7N884_9RHOB|nr:antifreeze protein [Palleronia aestuarii]PZX16288.1 hypothetical protein LX81_02140 [Palleronia aestuarii]